MKNSLTTILITAFATISHAQNTFPSSGNVGIGTTNPSYALDVNGSWALKQVGYFYSTAYAYEMSSNQYLHFRVTGGKGYVGMNTTNDLILQSYGGKVGIGVNPQVKLHVKSDYQTAIFESDNYNQLNLRHSGNPSWGLLLTNSDGASNDGYHYSTSAENNSAAVVNVNNDALHFGTNNIARATIDHTGNVGIGITTPVEKLDVDGSIALKDGYNISWGGTYGPGIPTIAASSSAGSGIYFHPNGSISGPSMKIDLSGNVGIGTGTAIPDAKLTVKGDIHAEEIIVDLNVPGPDYVFEEDYVLLSLEETEKYIKTHKHLPEIPSAKEMAEKGLMWPR